MDCRPLHPDLRAIVAIPACNEAARLGACLAALATQRDMSGAPLSPDAICILVYANNCSDDTAGVVNAARSLVPFAIDLVEAKLPPHLSHAGGARKAAMDRAADRLEGSGLSEGVILTTDADTRVCSTWVSRTLAGIDAGADAVAGYIEADPEELIGLGRGFLERSRLEDRYLAQIAEIYALCDPILHDPWPNHRVASGASLAVTLMAYRAIGGLPPRVVGEDAALVETLLVAGFRVRHDMDAVAITSCRFDGRAEGGAADTMRARHLDLNASCDGDVEPVSLIRRRATWKGAFRARFAKGRIESAAWNRRLALGNGSLFSLAAGHAVFESFWRAVQLSSPNLQSTAPLRPSELPAQIAAAVRVIARLREKPAGDAGARYGLDPRSSSPSIRIVGDRVTPYTSNTNDSLFLGRFAVERQEVLGN